MVKALFPPEIERLWRLGFAIHWLRPKSKIPINSGWTHGDRLTVEELNATFKRGYNYGVRLGTPSKVAGGYLAVVDVDVKSDDPSDRSAALAATFKAFPQLVDGKGVQLNSPHLLSGRGNGSAHYYVRVSEPTKGNELRARSEKRVKCKIDGKLVERPAWEVSLLCEGRQAAIVGSVHPDTGKAYTWGKAVDGSGKGIPLVEVTAKGVNAAGNASSVPEATDGFDFEDVDTKSLPLTEDQLAALVDGRGVRDRSAKIYELCLVLAAAKVPDLTIVSVFTDRANYLGATGFDHAHTSDRRKAARWIKKFCLRKAKLKVNDSPFDIEEIPEPKSDSEIKKKPGPKEMRERIWPVGFSGEDHDWETRLELRQVKGGPPLVKLTLANIQLILTNRAPQIDFVRLEEFSNKIHWTCDTPWGITAGSERSAASGDALRIKEWFAAEYKIEPSNIMIDEAIALTADHHRYHVVKNYLDALEWDHVERIPTALARYLGATMPDPYLGDVSRKFFLGCVKRIYEPGCKFDHVLVLEGKQGIGKSTFASILASDNWFLDGLPNFQDKDAALNLIGTWICELGELAALYRSANESTKAFITRRTDKVRPPFGPRRVDYPRSTVFLGTTNENEYFTDATGNRRFWPVCVKQCDFGALTRDRDQLWAEAVWRFHFANEPLFLSGEALHQAETVQELRRIEDEGDAMKVAFRRWLAESEKSKRNVSSIILADLFRHPWGRIQATQGNRMRAGGVLRDFGYQKKKTKNRNLWVKKRVDTSG